MRWPLAVTVGGLFDVMRSFLRPGLGERRVPTGYDAVGKGSLEVRAVLRTACLEGRQGACSIEAP